MKNINITLEDEKFKALSRAKEKTGLSWERFIMTLATKKQKRELKEAIN